MLRGTEEGERVAIFCSRETGLTKECLWGKRENWRLPSNEGFSKSTSERFTAKEENHPLLSETDLGKENRCRIRYRGDHLRKIF